MLTIRESSQLLWQYALSRIKEQLKAVALIVSYLILFQVFILGLPLANAVEISLGLSLVVVGLAFFMEGLILGLMPLGEVIGIRLPQKANQLVLLAFAFVLGLGATFAEPAIGVLKQAGATVKAWEAPLLYILLNQQSHLLVASVGGGVGIAVALGMLRFLYGWSLKPFIYVMISLGLGLVVWSFFNPNMLHLTGLAWDCGAVTTGPVTVPLVLALGIGISRVAGHGGGGFGVVTLASACPILAVSFLGLAFLNSVPAPSTEKDFFDPKNTASASMFTSADEQLGYMLQHASYESQLRWFGNSEKNMLASIARVFADEKLSERMFPGTMGTAGISAWLKNTAHPSIKNSLKEKNLELAGTSDGKSSSIVGDLFKRNTFTAVQAILPLTFLLLIVLWGLIREKLRKADEVFLGIGFAVIGMSLFNVGIESGLAKIGSQVGGRLASSYQQISLQDQPIKMNEFDASVILKAAGDRGREDFFFYRQGNETHVVPYNPSFHDSESKSYTWIKTHGPLYGKVDGFTGILVVLLFAFLMGYGATLAEPALNALGDTVERITVGAFKKVLLMQSVAFGVGMGLSLGIAKIIWDLPLAFILVPPYLVLLLLTHKSTEEFVNIAWDSAGVTTGPITVPLVLAMGIGIGGQSGVVEGFGILSMASVCPILAVLMVGMWVTRKRDHSGAQDSHHDDDSSVKESLKAA